MYILDSGGIFHGEKHKTCLMESGIKMQSYEDRGEPKVDALDFFRTIMIMISLKSTAKIVEIEVLSLKLWIFKLWD